MKYSATGLTPNLLHNDRDPVTDIARGAAMLLVILGHTLLIFFYNRPDGLFDYKAFFLAQAIQSFHMPAFYFISGMAAARLHERSFRQVATQALTLLLFAYTTHLLAVPFVAAAKGNLSDPLSLFKMAIKPFVLGTDFALAVPWFLVSIAAVQCLAWVYIRVSTRRKILLCAILLVIFIADSMGLKALFMNNTWGIGLFFFLVGRYFIRLGKINIHPANTFIAAFVAMAVVAYLHPLNKGCIFDPAAICNKSVFPTFGVNLSASQIGFLPIFLACAFTGIAALVLFSRSISSTYLAKIFIWIGQNTLSLLILNGSVLMIATPFLARHISGGSWSWLIWSSLITVAHIAILPIIKPGIDALHLGCKQVSEILIQSIKTRLSERLH